MVNIDNKKNYIINLYNTKHSLRIIGKIIGCGTSTIKRRLLKWNIKLKPKKSYTIYEVDENYFEIINTKDRAYFLGLMYADGNNFRSDQLHKISITMHKKDKYILDTFQKYLKSNYPIYSYLSRNAVGLHIPNRKMSEDLLKLGCIPRKSLILEFPKKTKIPDRLIRHFLRGYFDGDGCVSNYRQTEYTHYIISIAGSLKFIQCLRSYIYKKFGFKGSANIIKNKNEYAELRYNDYDNILTILDWLYQGCEDLKLNRKYNRYITMKNHKGRLFYSKYRKNNKNYKKRDYKPYGNNKCISTKVEFIE